MIGERGIKKAFEEGWLVAKMPVGDKMYIASSPTRSYDWEGYGDTPQHALAALEDKWRRYVADMKAAGEDVSGMHSVEEMLENAMIREIISGGATMDGSYTPKYTEEGTPVKRKLKSGFSRNIPDETLFVQPPKDKEKYRKYVADDAYLP